MRITAEQQKIVDSLKCERLSDNLDNIRLVEDFVNSRNDSIAQTLRNEAFREDEDNIVAYYVVKDSSNNEWVRIEVPKTVTANVTEDNDIYDALRDYCKDVIAKTGTDYTFDTFARGIGASFRHHTGGILFQ